MYFTEAQQSKDLHNKCGSETVAFQDILILL